MPEPDKADASENVALHLLHDEDDDGGDEMEPLTLQINRLLPQLERGARNQQTVRTTILDRKLLHGHRNSYQIRSVSS